MYKIHLKLSTFRTTIQWVNRNRELSQLRIADNLLWIRMELVEPILKSTSTIKVSLDLKDCNSMIHYRGEHWNWDRLFIKSAIITEVAVILDTISRKQVVTV